MMAMAISRGAMIPTRSPSRIPTHNATTISAPAHVRIDLIDDRQRLVSGIHTISYPVVERVNVPAAVFTTLPSKWQSDGALARFSRFHWDRGPALTV